jgi:hypothetical protein
VDRSPLARAPRAPDPQDLRLWGLGRGGVLVVETQSRIWDLGPRSLLVLDTRGHLQESGPRLGFGAQGGLWALESGSLLIPWSFCRVRVLGPRSGCRSSHQRLRLLWFWPLYDQYHAHSFIFGHDVEQQMFTELQSYQDWQRREVLLQLLECLIRLLVPEKGPDFNSSLKNGKARSASLEINRLSAAKHPMSFWTSLMRAGGRIPSIALIFSGLASIPRFKTKKPISFRAETPNTHLSGYNIMRIEHNLLKTMARLSNRDECDLILTTMSSTYTSTKSLIRSPNVLCMAHTNVGRALLRP